MNPAAELCLNRLLEGNARFRAGQGTTYRYAADSIAEIGDAKTPFAAVITCMDGRVTPEIVFDQPLGALLVCRGPGNTATDAALWMLEIAITNLKIPLVVVLGHTDCLAVGQIVGGGRGARAAESDIAKAVDSVREGGASPLLRAAIVENAIRSGRNLSARSEVVRGAVDAGEFEVVTALYDVHSGAIERLGVKEPIRAG